MKHVETQVNLWRRSYDIRPPALEKEDQRYPGHDEKYRRLPQYILPTSEVK